MFEKVNDPKLWVGKNHALWRKKLVMMISVMWEVWEQRLHTPITQKKEKLWDDELEVVVKQWRRSSSVNWKFHRERERDREEAAL